MRKTWLTPLSVSIVIHCVAFGALWVKFTHSTEVASGGIANVSVELGHEPSTGAKPTQPIARTSSAQTVSTEIARASGSGQGTTPNLGAQGSGGTATVAIGDPYYARVRAQIEEHLHYPASFARRRIGGKLTLEMTLDQKGILTALSLSESSGNSELDQWVLESVRKAAPFEAFQSGNLRSLRLPIAFLNR